MDSCCSISFFCNNKSFIHDKGEPTVQITDSHGVTKAPQAEGNATVIFIGSEHLEALSRPHDKRGNERATKSLQAKMTQAVFEKSTSLGLMSLEYCSRKLNLAFNNQNHESPFLYHREANFAVPVQIRGGIYLVKLLAYAHCGQENCKQCDARQRKFENPNLSLSTITSEGVEGEKLTLDNAIESNVSDEMVALSKLANHHIALLTSGESALRNSQPHDDAAQLRDEIGSQEKLVGSELERISKDAVVRLGQIQAGITPRESRVPPPARNPPREITLEKLHKVFGHVPVSQLRATFCNDDSPFKVTNLKWTHDNCSCPGCLNRLRRVLRHSVSIETKKRELRLEGDIKPFTSLSWDLKGKLCPAVLTKNQWILIFTCTAGSDFIVHYTLKKKSEAWTKVEPLLRLIYKKGWCVKTMHSDFDSLWSSSIKDRKLRKFRSEIERIGKELWNWSITVTYSLKSPNDNMRAELAILRTTTAANSLLIESLLAAPFWERAMALSVRAINSLINPNHLDSRMRTRSPLDAFDPEASVPARYWEKLGSKVICCRERPRPGKFGETAVMKGVRLWMGFPEDQTTGEISIPRGALVYRTGHSRFEVHTHFWVIDRSHLELRHDFIEFERKIMNPLEKKLYRELSKHILSIYMDPSKIVEPIQLVDDCILRLVRYDELGDKENESRDFPQYADDFSVNSDIEEKEEHSQSDDITPPVTGAEENMLADEDEEDDGYTYDISDVDRIVIGTRDDELESGTHDDEFDSEEEDEEEKLEEVQEHRLREVGETERRQLQKDGVTKPINESSPIDDEELKDARDHPGLFRQIPPEQKRTYRKRQHDLYQHLGQRVSVYFKVDKRRHGGDVTKIIEPEEDEPDGEPFLHVQFDDGDEADFTLEELRPHFVARDGPRRGPKRNAKANSLSHEVTNRGARRILDFLLKNQDTHVSFHNYGGVGNNSIQHPHNKHGAANKRFVHWLAYKTCSTVSEALSSGATETYLFEDIKNGRLLPSNFAHRLDDFSLVALVATQGTDAAIETWDETISFRSEFKKGLNRRMFRNGARVHLARSDETGIIESWNEETQEYTVLVESANEPSSPWGEEEHNDHPADKHVRATASFLTASHSSLSIDWAVDIANEAAHSLQSHNEQFAIAGYTAKLDALHTEVQLEDEIVERLKQRIDLIEKAQGCRSYPVTNIENELGPVEYENLLILGERAMSAYSCDTYTPKNYKDASSCKDKADWNDSMYEEIQTCIDLGCWKIISMEEMYALGLRQIGAGFVYKNKHDELGRLVRKKSRYVTRGYCQREGYDFQDSYATVTSYSTVRMLIALASESGGLLTSYDIANAFITSPLEKDEQTCVALPPNWQDPRFGSFFDRCKTEKCTMLCLNAQYGFKNSPRSFRLSLDKKLKQIGLVPSVQDDCLYTMEHPEHGTLRLAVWVDDVVLLSKDRAAANFFTEEMNKYFTLSEGSGDETHHFLGMRVERNGNMIKISNKIAIENLLKDFDQYLTRSKTYTARTPFFENRPLIPNTGTRYTEEQFPMRKLCGSVLHLSRTCRPDLSYAVSELSRHLNNVGDDHIQQAHRLLYYLRGTSDLGIIYSPTGDNNAYRLLTYGDSDWASDPTTRKSRTGFLHMMSNAAIEYYSKGQSLVSDSSCMAETVASCEAIRSILHFRIVLIELGYKQIGSSVLYGDNQATVLNSNSKSQSPRSKHFQIRTELLRAITRSGRAHIVKVDTKDNLSDLFTKQMGIELFEKLRNGTMGLNSPEARAMCECLSDHDGY